MVEIDAGCRKKDAVAARSAQAITVEATDQAPSFQNFAVVGFISGVDLLIP